jgi:hypothetical protein
MVLACGFFWPCPERDLLLSTDSPDKLNARIVIGPSYYVTMCHCAGNRKHRASIPALGNSRDLHNEPSDCCSRTHLRRWESLISAENAHS